jgi:poly-gamma-glutamate capsule biosynthesis protein CapA/YwtB (metallophosphatase superfamily)
MKHLPFLFLLFILTISCHSQEAVRKVVVLPDTSRIRIIFAGDMMGHMPIVNAAYVDSLKTYDYSQFLEYVHPYTASADLAVVNLEVPLAGQPYSGYPQFSSPDALVDGLKKNGFQIFITANNHCLDRGKQGLERTLQTLDSLKIKHTGTFRDTTEKRRLHPLIVEKNKFRIAILNYTYGINGFKPKYPNIVNIIDTARIRQDIRAAKSQVVDFVIVALHWGIEYQRMPSKEQYVVGESIRKCGADAVIGAHPHVVEPVDMLRHVQDTTDYFPVVYSLGNFVSNQRDRYRDGGIIFELELEKVADTRIKAVRYLPVWVYKGIIKNRMGYRLIPPFMFDNAVRELGISEADRQKCQEFYNDTRQLLENIPEAIP